MGLDMLNFSETKGFQYGDSFQKALLVAPVIGVENNRQLKKNPRKTQHVHKTLSMVNCSGKNIFFRSPCGVLTMFQKFIHVLWAEGVISKYQMLHTV